MNLYRIFKSFEKHRIDKISEMISGDKLTVLEIGCNDGKFLYENRFKWESAIGVDIDSNLLVKAKERSYGVKVKFLKADFGRNPMPYDDNQFDLVVSIASLQYIYDLDLLFAEIHRVVKKNGIFIFEVPNVGVFFRRFQLLFGNFPNTSYKICDLEDNVIHYFTAGNLVSFLQKKGFYIEKISCSGILDGIREKWASFLGADLIFVCRNLK